MHGKIDRAGEQRLLDLFREQALAAGVGERPVATISSAPGSSPCACASRARTFSACARASGLPRVPMRRRVLPVMASI
jgi:hypothetical protein